MNKTQFGGALALSILLVACGGEQNAGPANNQASNAATPAAQSTETYSASGEVTAVSAGQVTISHGPVEALGWPAMTMAFKAPSADMIRGVSAGDQVSFAFTQDGSAYTLTSITKER